MGGDVGDEIVIATTHLLTAQEEADDRNANKKKPTHCRDQNSWRLFINGRAAKSISRKAPKLVSKPNQCQGNEQNQAQLGDVQRNATLCDAGGYDISQCDYDTGQFHGDRSHGPIVLGRNVAGCGLLRPFRTYINPARLNTQGVALGFRISARWAELPI
jgi:hypothetical protein